jgi:hypothetical protein
VNVISIRKHRSYVRHITSVHRTGPYLCKFRRKCLHTFYDRGKLLVHIKEKHYTPTVTQITLDSLVEAPLECPLERRKFT